MTENEEEQTLNYDDNEINTEIDENDGLIDLDILTEGSDRPLITSPEWHDYVMSKFSPEELLKEKDSKGEYTGKNYPSVYGLRRVAELLIGEIIENSSNFIEISSGFAIAECELGFRDEYGEIRRFSDVGNCHAGSTDAPYDAHLPSIAATRAEGRALRKALRIRTVSAEEMQGGKNRGGGSHTLEEVDSVGLEGLNRDNQESDGAQAAAILTMCKREQLDMTKLIQYKYGADKTAPNDLKHGEARELLAFIHQVTAKKVVIPEEIRLETSEKERF